MFSIHAFPCVETTAGSRQLILWLVRPMDEPLARTPHAERGSLPLSAKIAAIYLIVAGVTSIPWLFVAPSPEVAAAPVATRAGFYTREVMAIIAFIVAGVAVLRRRTWGRKFAVVLLVIWTVYAAYGFAHGFAGWKAPSGRALLLSFVVVGVWHGFWIYLLLRKGRSDAARNA